MSTYHPMVRFTAPLLGMWVVAVFAPWIAPAEDILHARISQESGGALVRGTDDTDWSYATVNTILLPGDTLWIDREGTLEAEMAGGSFLRMADRSKAELKALPPNATINAWTGSFYVQRVSRSTGDFRLRSPAATINIDRDTQVRVDVVGEGSTTVSVRWGRVTVATDGGVPVEATNGQRVYIDPGLLPSNPIPFDKTVEDSFDAWNRERARLLALGDSALPASVRVEQTPIGYSDLASYGEWVYVDNRQYWRPTIVREYVPYRDGYWSYIPVYGYTWIGTYPFCYVTSHYGRWNYYPAYGWLWCYDPVWSPAWCATAYYGGNFVWCPLDYYNRPCSYGATFYVGGIPFSIGYSSYCHANDLLYYGPCSVYPCYGNQFVNVNINNIYVWNIYSNKYPHKYPYYGSTALFREYNPRRVIRGIESGGAFTVAASQRARALSSELGRTEFVPRSTAISRSVRTAQTGNARQAQVRNASLGPDSALDTGSTIRRAQRTVESLRGSDDNKPQVVEARRTRVASLERSAAEAQNSKLPGATTRAFSSRSVRDENGTETIQARGGRSADFDSANSPRLGNRSTSTLRTERRSVESTPQITDTTVPRGQPTERIVNRDTRRLDTDPLRDAIDLNGRSRAASSSSRTLDDTRVRVNTPGSTDPTPATDPARMREPNLPRISGGDGRDDRSQPMGTLPQTPQRSRAAYNPPVQTFTPEPSSSTPQNRIFRDSGRSDRMRESAQTFTPQQPTPIQMEPPRTINSAPRARYETFTPTIQRFEVQPQQPQYSAPRIERSLPQVNIPQRFEAPQQPRFAAPQPRVEVPQRFEAPPSSASVNRPSISGPNSLGGTRFEGRSAGDSGGRGRSR